MARKQVITREVISTEIETMLCNTKNGDISFEHDDIVGKISEKKAKQTAKERYEKNEVVVVKVTLTEKRNKYSMDLGVFVRHADIVDAEPVNPVETENE